MEAANYFETSVNIYHSTRCHILEDCTFRSYRREKIRDSVVGIATGYVLDERGVEVRVPVRSRISLLRAVQAVSGVHPASYPMVTEGSFPGVERPDCEADHSTPASAQVKKVWMYTSTPPHAFMA
jgi:hypothetical protein